MLLSAVLLICMLFIMQPIKTGINIDIPKVDTDAFEIYDDFQYANVQIRKDGLIFINGRPVAATDIENILFRITFSLGVGLLTMYFRIKGIFVEGMALPVLIMYIVALIAACVIYIIRNRKPHTNNGSAQGAK